jgi:hypothetical protein
VSIEKLSLKWGKYSLSRTAGFVQRAGRSKVVVDVIEIVVVEKEVAKLTVVEIEVVGDVVVVVVVVGIVRVVAGPVDVETAVAVKIIVVVVDGVGMLRQLQAIEIFEVAKAATNAGTARRSSTCISVSASASRRALAAGALGWTIMVLVEVETIRVTVVVPGTVEIEVTIDGIMDWSVSVVIIVGVLEEYDQPM